MAGRKVVVTVAARRSEGEDQGIRAKARPTGSVEPGFGAGETSRPVEKWRRRLEKHGRRDVVTVQPPRRDHRKRKRRKGRGCRDRRVEKREERTRSMEAAKGKILKLWKKFAALKTAGAATKIGQAWRRSRRTRRGRLRPEAKEFRSRNLRPEAEEFVVGSQRAGRRKIKYFNLPIKYFPAEHKPGASGPTDQRVLNPAARPKAQRRVNPPGYKRAAGAMFQQRQMEIAATRRRVLSAVKQKRRRKLNLEFRKVRGDPTGRHAAMRRMQEDGDVDGMRQLKASTMKDLRRQMVTAHQERGRVKNAAHSEQLRALKKLLEDNSLGVKTHPEQVKSISDYCLLYIDPLLMREAKMCYKESKGLSNAKLGKLRQGLADTWENLRIDASATAMGLTLWGSILQEFPNLEGVKESEYLKYPDSESESDCEGRFSSCMDGGDDEGSESESE